MRASPSTTLIACCLLAGCVSVDERPAPPVFPADAAFNATPAAPPYPAEPGTPWWRRVTADDIAAAVEAALRSNIDLRRAGAEVDAARARLEQAEADQGPSLLLDANVRAQRASGEGWNESAAAALDGDLPLDLSGALARREEAARNELVARVADVEQLQSDLARDYLLAVVDAGEALQRDILLRRQIDSAQTLLRLIELRFTQGLASSVDVLQQRDELAALKQQLPAAALDRSRALNALRRTAGQTPATTVPLTVEDLPGVQAGFARARPVDLLERRPDLRAQRARLAAADARFAAAVADQLPTLNLSAGWLARATAGDVTTLLTGALEAAFTVFDSGNQRAIAYERRAQLAAAGEAYLARWVELVIEVDDLIATESGLRERIELSRLRLDTAEALLDAAQRRYERGVSDYLPVLAALRGLQQQQRDHLALRAALASARIRLHHGIGDPPPEGEA